MLNLCVGYVNIYIYLYACVCMQDAVIIRETTVRRRIIQIGSGRVRIEKSIRQSDGSQKNVILGRMGAGEVSAPLEVVNVVVAVESCGVPV
jgi:hypothetical protein